MNPKGIWLLRGFVFITCIFWGRWLGQSLFSREMEMNSYLAHSNITEPVLITESHPQTLLLIQFNHPIKPNLRAIWQVRLDPHNSPQWVLLYPTANQPTLDSSYQNRFQIIKSEIGNSHSLNLAPEFTGFLNNMDYSWDEIWLLDDIAVADLVDWLGGIKPNNTTKTQSGEEILANLRDENLTRAQLFHYQHSLWREICWKLYQTAQPAVLDQLTSLQPDHFIIHLDNAESMAMYLWKEQLQSQNQPYCEFPLYEKYQVEYFNSKQ